MGWLLRRIVVAAHHESAARQRHRCGSFNVAVGALAPVDGASGIAAALGVAVGALAGGAVAH